MNKRIVFTGLEPLDLIKQHVEKELTKLDKILAGERSPIFIDTEIESLRGGVIHRVEIVLKTPNYDLIAHYECPDVYEAINIAADKLNKELHRAKERKVDTQQTGAFHREG